MSEISADTILKDAELIATVTHKLEKRHNKAKARDKGQSQKLLPSFELCLQKNCKDIFKHYNLKTHEFIYPIKFCEKLISYTYIKPKQSKISQDFSQRDLKLIYVALANTLLSADTKGAILLKKVEELTAYSGIKITTS